MEDAETKMIIDRLDSQSADIKALTKSISELTTVLAKKEVADQHVAEELRRVDTKITKIDERVLALEMVAAGDKTLKTIRDWFIRSLVGAAAIGFVAGIVYLIKAIA